MMTARNNASPVSLATNTDGTGPAGTDLCEMVAREDAAYGSYDPLTRDHVHALRLAQCRTLMES